MLVHYLLFPSLIWAGLVASRRPRANPTQDGCKILRQHYPESTIFPGTARYDFENTCKGHKTCRGLSLCLWLLDSWSATAWLGPACVFAPNTPKMVSFAVNLFAELSVPFAVRAGGGMTVDNAANIGPEGILISSTNFTEMRISGDLQSVSVGPGIRWPEFYAYLDTFNRTLDGIRLGNVGVVGLLLGGGIGFFSYEHGSISTEVQSFEVCYLRSE